jgi:hypothetical protein
VFCWCLSTFPYCVLLVFVDVPLLCFVGVFSVALNCALLLFLDAYLFCFVVVRQCLLTIFCWCSLVPFFYVLLLFVDASLLCFVVIRWCFLVVFY